MMIALIMIIMIKILPVSWREREKNEEKRVESNPIYEASLVSNQSCQLLDSFSRITVNY